MGFCELYFTPLFQSFSISPSLILVITLYHHEVYAAKSILLVVQKPKLCRVLIYCITAAFVMLNTLLRTCRNQPLNFNGRRDK